jgi:N-methylhydantoinase A/oxoprolinase/acetone carboxylase beta subunit
MRIGVNVGGIPIDTVLMNSQTVVAWAKTPATSDGSRSLVSALTTLLAEVMISTAELIAVMVGTTYSPTLS